MARLPAPRHLVAPLLFLSSLTPIVAATRPVAQGSRIRDTHAPSRPKIGPPAAVTPIMDAEAAAAVLIPRQDAEESTPSSSRSSRSTTSRTSTTTPPPVRVTVADYSYLGCFQDGSNHILTVKSQFDTGMTPELCRNLCLVAECGIFGLKDQYSCLCGREVEPFAVSAPESECLEKCRGNTAVACGASGRMNVYSATVSLTAVDRGAVPTAGGNSDNGSGDDSSPDSNDDGSGSGSNNDGKKGGGLASGAVAGIAIGCILIGALLAGGIGFFLFRRRRNAKNEASGYPTAIPPASSSSPPASGMAGSSLAGPKSQHPEMAYASSDVGERATSEYQQQQQQQQQLQQPTYQYAPQGVSPLGHNATTTSVFGGSTVYEPSSAFMSPMSQAAPTSGGLGAGAAAAATVPPGNMAEAHGQQIYEAPGLIAYEMSGEGTRQEMGAAGTQPQQQQQQQYQALPPPGQYSQPIQQQQQQQQPQQQQ